MKFVPITVLALCAALTSAAEETSLNVGQVISAYVVGTTLSIPAAESTSLASAINSVASTWYESPQLTSLNSAILAAAPTQAAESFASSGIPYGLIVTESWYTKGVPTALQSVLQAQFSALDSAEAMVLGTPTPTPATSQNMAMETGAPVIVMGVMGAVGGVMALL